METAKTPQVSIILPTYNRSAALRRAIASVEKQSFSDWELIIIDDASTDDTQKVVKEIATRDSRVVYIRNERNYYPDITRTLNKGLAAARGEFIARIDDDDFWLDEQKLKKQIKFLINHPDYVVVGSGMMLVDPDGNKVGRYLKKETDKEIRNAALFSNPFSHTTVMFRADVARKVGGYGDWRFAEDWDLWLKMGRFGKFYNFPEYLAAYTVSDQNKSFIHLRAQTKMIFEFLRIHRGEYPGYVKAWTVNMLQYCYSFFPWWFRIRFRAILADAKRRIS